MTCSPFLSTIRCDKTMHLTIKVMGLDHQRIRFPINKRYYWSHSSTIDIFLCVNIIYIYIMYNLKYVYMDR